MKYHHKFFIVMLSLLILFSNAAVYAESKILQSALNFWVKNKNRNKNKTAQFYDSVAERKVPAEKPTSIPFVSQPKNDLSTHANTAIPKNESGLGAIDCLSQATLNPDIVLELIPAIERAVCYHPDAHSAWIQTKIQAAQLGMSKSGYYPQINTTLNHDWGKDDYQVKSRNDLSYDTNTRRYGITIQANWLLYDFGVRKHQVGESEKLLAMSLAQRDSVLQGIILKTIMAYYQVIQVELKLENLQQLTVLAEQNYRIAHARYQAGAGIKYDELQMQANLAKAKADQTKLSGELKISQGNLAALMGEPAYQNFKINSQVKIPSVLNLKSIQDLIAESEQINPKFKAAQLGVEAATEKVKSTQKLSYPALSLISNYNNSEQTGESPFANNTQRIQAGVQLSLPLFDGFSQKNQVVLAHENLKLKQSEQALLKQQMGTEIWKSYNELQAVHDNIQALSVLNESAEGAYQVAQGRYKAGVGNLLEVLNAQNLLIEAKMDYATSVINFLIVRYQLLANIGNLNLWSDEPA